MGFFTDRAVETIEVLSYQCLLCLQVNEYWTKVLLFLNSVSDKTAVHELSLLEQHCFQKFAYMIDKHVGFNHNKGDNFPVFLFYFSLY